MSFIDDIKAQADANRDGKLSFDDLERLREQHPEAGEHISRLQNQADSNEDGKVDFADAEGILADLQSRLAGMFGSK